MISDKKFIHIPIDYVIKPTDGAVVYAHRYWTIHKTGHISIYVRDGSKSFSSYNTWSPRCNSNEAIATSRGKYDAVKLPFVFLQEGQGVESYE